MGEAANAHNLEDLFGRCREGDEAAFAGIYQRLARGLYGTALRMLGRPEEAEDIVQETFLTFHDRCRDLDPAQAPAWLKRVLVNGCIDRIRRRRRRPRAELTEEMLPVQRRSEALQIDLERATARLPERARLVFLLHDVEGFAHREVASLLGVTEGASKSQLFRARGLLRGHLSPGGRTTP